MTVSKQRGRVGAWLPGKGSGLAWRVGGGARASVAGGVGGRGHGPPGTEQISQRVSVFFVVF